MRLPRRRGVGFNLAFLDIMSCGLGAIILIFMLVKYHTEQPDTQGHSLQAELNSIQNEIDSIEAANRSLAEKTEVLKASLREKVARTAQSNERSSAAARELIQLITEITRTEKKLARQQEDAAQSAPTPGKAKPVQEHLIGLRVRGARIVILLDTSASMADERLVDIIKIKVSNIAAKKSAPKWRRTLAVARWIIDRVPEGSEYMVISYNSKANFLHARKWLRGGDASEIALASQALEELYPQNATNLHAALALMKKNSISPTDMYVITDSLPTQGGGISRAAKLKACGTGKKTTVSGSCRLALFNAATRSSTPASARVNTVLLPVEGDPEAAYAYWLWTAKSAGMMISPAGSWP